MSDKNNLTDNELIEEIRKGDSDYENELIFRYRATVEAIAAKYIDSPLEKEDLIQEGMIGLLAAIKSFNLNKGTKFVTYASRCINNSVKSAIKKFTRLKDIPPSSLTQLDEDFEDSQYALSAEDEFLAKEL